MHLKDFYQYSCSKWLHGWAQVGNSPRASNNCTTDNNIFNVTTGGFLFIIIFTLCLHHIHSSVGNTKQNSTLVQFFFSILKLLSLLYEFCEVQGLLLWSAPVTRPLCFTPQFMHPPCQKPLFRALAFISL